MAVFVGPLNGSGANFGLQGNQTGPHRLFFALGKVLLLGVRLHDRNLSAKNKLFIALFFVLVGRGGRWLTSRRVAVRCLRDGHVDPVNAPTTVSGGLHMASHRLLLY